MKSIRLLSALAILGAVTAAAPVNAGDRTVPIEGLLVQDDLDGEKLERKLLRDGIRDANRYRALTGLYVLRAPSKDFWDDQMAPALEDAMDSDRPLETLRGTLLGMEDLLIAGPQDPAVQIRWTTPGDRGGMGFINLAAPVLIGPDGGLTGHRSANKLQVVSGWFVDETRDDPSIEAVGLNSYPDAWSGGDVRLPRLNSIPDGGEAGWVKYKGRSEEDGGEKFADAVRAVERVYDRNSVRVDRVISWPRESGERLRDTLTSARYKTRVPEARNPGQLMSMLRGEPVADWDWDEDRVKHPTRYGVAVMSANAETADGDEVAETFAFVYLYTPLFVDFEEAHLYVGTSPEFFATAVQKGEIPFFERGDEPVFYVGHLDRWIVGDALKPAENPISRRIIERTADRWVRDLDGRDARNVSALAREPLHWPLRMVEADSDEDRPYKVLAYKDDLVTWWRRFESSLRPEDMDWLDETWTVKYSGVATRVDLGPLFQTTADRDLQVAVVAEVDEQSSALAEREQKGLSDKERARLEAERKEAEKERLAAEKERQKEEDARAKARAAEEKRLAEEEAAREKARVAQQNAPIDVRLREVLVGTREEGKPYLATRAGRSIPIKVKYDVEGKSDGHTVQVVAQAYDQYGAPLDDFQVRSTKKTPTAGENETTTFLKVPSNYGSDKNGSYRVMTRLELDGVPVKGEREEFVHLGPAIAVPRVELDPSVVLPGEEAFLLMDLALGGWSIEDDVALDVAVTYTVGDASVTDSFPMTRGIGYHELEVDMDVPKTLPSGDGTYSVTVSTASGSKATAKGTLRVFAAEVVESEPEDGGRRGRRRRVAVEEDEELAALASQAREDDGDRDVVRRTDDDEDDLFDFDTSDELAEVEAEREREREERARRKEEERRRREAEESERAEAERRQASDDRRRAEDEKRREAERREKEDAERRERERREKERAAELVDLDEDDEDEPRQEERREEKPRKEAKEEAPAFDWDALPESVFFEEESEEVMMWAEADGVGVVRVYGEPALDAMGNWWGAQRTAYEDGAPEWLWICYEGEHEPRLRFERYSSKEGAWVTVWQSPIRWGSREEKKQALALMKAVFEGFVPEKKKKIPFGKL